MPYFGAEPSSELANLDINGQKFILDADADTSITADTDDTIDIEIAGADDFQFTANTFTVLSGSTLAVASGATIANSGTATGFGALDGIDDQSSSNDDQLTITDTAVIINEDSDDVDFRVESNGQANMLFVDGGADTVGIGGVSTGPQFLVKQKTNSDRLSGIGIQDNDTNDTFMFSLIASGTILDVSKCSNASGADEAGDFGQLLALTEGGEFHVGDQANTFMTVGVNVNQGAADNEILTLKSSDIAHGITGETETDTWGLFKKSSGTAGGMNVQGITEDIIGLYLRGYVVNENSTKTSSGNAAILMFGGLKSGTSVDNMSANANTFAIQGVGGNTKFIVDTDGDVFYDGSAASYDEYDDAGMLRTFMQERSPKGIIKTEFDKWVSYNKKSLEECGIIGTVDPDDPACYHEDGSLSEPLVCMTQLQRFEVGAIVQQRAMFETMKSVVEDMLPGFASKLNERLEAQSLPALPA